MLDSPVYTISGRHKVPVDDRVKVPAPGTYSPEKVQFLIQYMIMKKDSAKWLDDNYKRNKRVFFTAIYKNKKERSNF